MFRFLLCSALAVMAIGCSRSPTIVKDLTDDFLACPQCQGCHTSYRPAARVEGTGIEYQSEASTPQPVNPSALAEPKSQYSPPCPNCRRPPVPQPYYIGPVIPQPFAPVIMPQVDRQPDQFTNALQLYRANYVVTRDPETQEYFGHCRLQSPLHVWVASNQADTTRYKSTSQQAVKDRLLIDMRQGVRPATQGLQPRPDPLHEVKTGDYACMKCRERKVGADWHQVLTHDGPALLFMCERCWQQSTEAERKLHLETYMEAHKLDQRVREQYRAAIR